MIEISYEHPANRDLLIEACSKKLKKNYHLTPPKEGFQNILRIAMEYVSTLQQVLKRPYFFPDCPFPRHNAKKTMLPCLVSTLEFPQAVWYKQESK